MSEIIEEWRDIKSYEGKYQVSNIGRVKSLNYNHTGKEKNMKQKLTKYGYYQIGLRKDGKQKMFLVHQLVSQSFLGHVIDGFTMVVNHINGIKTDNRVENLEIVSNRDNSSFCHRKDRDTMCSPLPGVSWSKSHNKWRSQYQYKGLNYYLGLFNTDIEAHNKWYEAYEADKKGEFEIFNLQFKRLNKSGINQYTKSGEFIREWKSSTEAGNTLFICLSNIIKCCKGKQNSAGNFKWSYKEKEED